MESIQQLSAQHTPALCEPRGAVTCKRRSVCGAASACLRTDPNAFYVAKLSLDWKTGVAATDWDTIAKKEHLDQLSVEMRKLEGVIREVYAEMLQLQQREQEMRDLNGEHPVGSGWRSPRRSWACSSGDPGTARLA
jgi:hypothetical protein